jgi:hypothetical protein
VAHELVMACITKKIRGYGFLAMMLQLPIVAVQRSRLLKGQRTFNVQFIYSRNHLPLKLTPGRCRYAVYALLTAVGLFRTFASGFP